MLEIKNGRATTFYEVKKKIKIWVYKIIYSNQNNIIEKEFLLTEELKLNHEKQRLQWEKNSFCGS